MSQVNELVVNMMEHEAVEDDTEELYSQIFGSNSEFKDKVENIKEILKSLKDGEINISPYDTAWVARIQGGDGRPEFPSSLEWIINNQLPDGSWGDDCIFLAHDRIINTLACIVALKAWQVYPDKCEKGISFINENMSKLKDESVVHMTIAFDKCFPVLAKIGQSYGIVLEDSPIMQEMNAEEGNLLARIPMELMHNVPTFLLHSLEGFPDLEWEKLLRIQSKDGSFLYSPASTAYAAMQTKNEKCLQYLSNIVAKFNGGVPTVYPTDLFEHIWVIDRLQRLGISHFFQPELHDCISYVYRHWTDRGITFARNSDVPDIDDTSMGFRLLRLYGYPVSADVFKQFEINGEFFCYMGQTTQYVTEMYDLLRAAQIPFPGEQILDQAWRFTSKFLRDKQASNQLLDKWIIAKDLPGEVTYALDIPWYASLPRVEARFYIEQYGGAQDVWIGKTLYRMPYVSNNDYLELAKLDYNRNQALHQLEWKTLARWHLDNDLGLYGVKEESVLQAYFLAAATLYEPKMSSQRVAWAKTIALVEAIDFCFGKENRKDIVNQFKLYNANQRKSHSEGKDQNLVGLLVNTLTHLALDVLTSRGRNVHDQLNQAWEKWLKMWEEEGDKHKGKAELLVQTIELCGGSHFYNDDQMLCLLELANHLCHRLGHLQIHNNKWARVNSEARDDDDKIVEVEEEMQKFTELVLPSSVNYTSPTMKRTCLAVVKTFYYSVHCSPKVISYHIHKVLFEKVA